MAILAGFSAIVSGFEAYIQHRRGAFSQWLMWTPVLLTPPMMIATGLALVSRSAARVLLPFASIGSLSDGVIGFVFHLRGMQRMPGGFKLGQYNVVMGPPIFAPLLLTLVGILGLLAEFLRREEPEPGRLALAGLAFSLRGGTFKLAKALIKNESALDRLKSQVAEGRFQQTMALISAFLAILAGGEAYFEHMRGSYNQRVMWTPVWVTPPMVGAAIGTVISRRVAEWVLPVTSVITFFDGILGFMLHLRGIKRMPGSLENLDFNITMGPPLFAPLLFSAVGLLGFLAVLLRRQK